MIVCDSSLITLTRLVIVTAHCDLLKIVVCTVFMDRNHGLTVSTMALADEKADAYTSVCFPPAFQVHCAPSRLQTQQSRKSVAGQLSLQLGLHVAVPFARHPSSKCPTR